KELQTALKPLQDLNSVKLSCDQTAEHINDLISVRRSDDKQQFPVNPERFDIYSMYGSWALRALTQGHTEESVQRKGAVRSGYWLLKQFDAKYTAQGHPLTS
ncbi:unnamed protein product, partial [Coregonus sp. 'balchen']